MIDTFPNIIAFSVLGLLLVIGTVLRSKISIFQYGLIPASLIGGIVGFTVFSIVDIPSLNQSTFASFTFHFFTLSFISLSLMQGEKVNDGEPKVLQGSTWLSTIWISSLMIQTFIGLAVILFYNFLTSSDTSPYLGIIATHGFTQGPGQALAIGNIWEQNFGIEGVIVVGIIYATIGFIVSFLIGVPVARWAIKKGITTNKAAKLDEEFTRGIYKRTTIASAGRQITHPANIDSLAWHFSILGIVYLVTHIWLVFLQSTIGDSEFFGINVGLVTSHNLFFAHGLIIALIARKLLKVMKWNHYMDNDTQKRITGTSVDFMMVAMLMSIQVSVLLNLLVPILMVSVVVTVVTACLCFGLGRRLANYNIERALTSFGTCTGSAGSALLLLRIVDPDFSTPISRELAVFNVMVTIGTFHIWALFAPTLPSLTTLLAVGVYLATLIAAGFIFINLRISKAQKEV